MSLGHFGDPYVDLTVGSELRMKSLLVKTEERELTNRK
jgi:hypothetical protein